MVVSVHAEGLKDIRRRLLNLPYLLIWGNSLHWAGVRWFFQLARESWLKLIANLRTETWSKASSFHSATLSTDHFWRHADLPRFNKRTLPEALKHSKTEQTVCIFDTMFTTRKCSPTSRRDLTSIGIRICRPKTTNSIVAFSKSVIFEVDTFNYIDDYDNQVRFLLYQIHWWWWWWRWTNYI